MPADRLTNVLDSASYSKGQPLKGSLTNKNQLVSSSDFSAFNLELDHQVAKSQVSQAAANARQSSRQNDSTSGNSLPTREQDTQAKRQPIDSNRQDIADRRARSSADQRSDNAEQTHSRQRSARDNVAREAAERNGSESSRSSQDDARANTGEASASSGEQTDKQHQVAETQGGDNTSGESAAKHEGSGPDEGVDQVNGDAAETAALAEQDYELDLTQKLQSESVLLADQIESAGLIEQHLQQQKMLGDKLLSEELSKQINVAGLEKLSESEIPTELKSQNELNLLLQQALNAQSFDKSENLSLDEVLSTDGIEQALETMASTSELQDSGLMSMADRLRALLGETQSESEIALSSDAVQGTEIDLALDDEAVDDINAALTSIESLVAELALPAAAKQPLIQDINQLKLDLANSEGKAVNGEGLKAVMAQLEQLKVSSGQTSIPTLKTNLDGTEQSVKLLEGSADVEGFDQLSNKLELKSIKGEISNAELAIGKDKPVNSDQLMQKLGAMVEQLRSSMKEGRAPEQLATSTKAGGTSSVTASPLVGVAKPADMQSAQTTAANKPFSMTMQQHFSKPGWGSELGQRLMMMVGQKIQVAEIRLDPPDLGPMEVKVRMQQEQANVVFTTQHAAVKDALEQALPRLKDMFEQNGLSLGDVDVQDQTQQNQNDEADDSNGQGSAELVAGEGDEESEETVTKVIASDRIVDFYA